jgi:hypothetical protein
MIVFLGPAENDKNFERAIRKYYSLRDDQEVGPHVTDQSFAASAVFLQGCFIASVADNGVSVSKPQRRPQLEKA